jgi:uncharacterized membrane protein
VVGLSVTSEMVTASTAMAGLVLVYIGTLVASYSTFEPQEKRTVRNRFLIRAYLALFGMFLAVVSATLGILAKWSNNENAADAGVVILLVAFCWGLLVAYLTIRELD